MLHGLVLGRRVVLGDHDHGGGERQADQRAQPHAHGVIAHDVLGDEVKCDRRDHRRDDDALVQRVHDLAAFAGGDEEGADDGGDDGNRAEHQRKQNGALAHVRHDQAAEQHGGDQGDGVGLEQVGRHAGAVADIVADVVGDDRRIARIVFGNAGFDLADQVRADVGALGENAAAQARENRDQRTAEGQADQRAQCRFGIAEHAQHDEVVAGDAEQAEADHQHAGDGAAAERDLERGVDAGMRRLRGAHIGAHGDEHADVAGQSGEDGAHGEAAGGGPVQRQTQGHEQNDADDGDGGVLPVQVSLGARLNRRGDFLHARIAGRLRQNPAYRNDAVEDCNNTGCNRQP